MLRARTPLAAALTFGLVLGAMLSTHAAEFSIKKEENGDVAFYIDGEFFTRYVTSDTVTNKVYFWPVVGPTGEEMTRAYPMANVEGEKQDHPHHRSVCFGMQEAGGYNTWHETMTFTRNGVVDPDQAATLGRQVVDEVVKAEADGNSAVMVVDLNNVTPEGDVYLKQRHTVRFTVAPNGSRVMDFDITLTGVKDSITIKGKKDSGLSVRVAHSMCVDAGEGGHIMTSDGDADGDAWGKRASWVDFNGPVEGDTVGVAILNHPSSFRYPTPWHARTYGLFTANAFALKEVAGEEESGDFDLAKDETFTLRHRIIFHEGDEKAAKIADAWKEYIRY